MTAKKFHWLYRETAYNSWCYSVITQADNFYRTRIVCRGVNYVKRKPLMFAYPNEKLTSYILERWPKKYVCIRVRIYVCVYKCARRQRSGECAIIRRGYVFFPLSMSFEICESWRDTHRAESCITCCDLVQIPEPSMSLIVNLIRY